LGSGGYAKRRSPPTPDPGGGQSGGGLCPGGKPSVLDWWL
jgi:hypothetical protein